MKYSILDSRLVSIGLASVILSHSPAGDLRKLATAN